MAFRDDQEALRQEVDGIVQRLDAQRSATDEAQRALRERGDELDPAHHDVLRTRLAELHERARPPAPSVLRGRDGASASRRGRAVGVGLAASLGLAALGATVAHRDARARRHAARASVVALEERATEQRPVVSAPAALGREARLTYFLRGRANVPAHSTGCRADVNVRSNAQGPSVTALAVTCGTRAVYRFDASDRAGVVPDELAQRAGYFPGAYIYQLRLSAAGAAGSSVELDSFERTLRVQNAGADDADAWEFELEPWSLPVAVALRTDLGPTDYTTTAATTYAALRVTEARGSVPGGLGVGAACELAVYPGVDPGLECLAVLRCDGRYLYGRPHAGSARCTLDRAAAVRTFRDDAPTHVDNDPQLFVDLGTDVVRASDRGRHGDSGWSVVLERTPSARAWAGPWGRGGARLRLSVAQVASATERFVEAQAVLPWASGVLLGSIDEATGRLALTAGSPFGGATATSWLRGAMHPDGSGIALGDGHGYMWLGGEDWLSSVR